MANEPKGAYNRAPVFNGENYSYWKDCMRVHINSIDRKIWNVILNGPIQITMTNENDELVPSPKHNGPMMMKRNTIMIGKPKIS